MYEELMADIISQEESVAKRVLSGNGKINSKVEVEDVLLEINRLERETEFLRELKKHRTSPIDRRIKEDEGNVETLRNAALTYMTENNESKLAFPDVAKISIRNQPVSFEIADQQKVESHLQKIGVLTDVAESVWKFDKKKLNALLKDLKTNNNLPDGVSTVEGKVSIAISFDDGAEDRSKLREHQVDASRWKKVDDKMAKSADNFAQVDI